MTSEQREKVLALVKARLGINDGKQDALLLIYIDEIGQRILHYISRYKMPDALLFAWSGMVSDYVRTDQVYNSDILGDAAASNTAVTSISEGDTSISMGAKQGGTAAALAGISQDTIDSLLRGYKLDLHRWRRIT